MPPKTRFKSKLEQLESPFPKNAIKGFLDCVSHSFFQDDAACYPKNKDIVDGRYDVVSKTFYPETAPGDPIANTPYAYGTKYPGPIQSIPPTPPLDEILPVDPESLLSFPGMDQLLFFAIHLLIGRIKLISKSRLLKDIDIIAANRGFSYRKLEFISSIDEKKHKLFKYEGQYSCLLTLQNAVLVSSAPEPTVGPSSAQAIFSFAYKAHMKTKSIGTLNRYTLQYLCDTSYDLLNSTKEGIVLRGGFPPDPIACSHLLQIIRQKVMGTYNLSSDSFNIIYESRPLTALVPTVSTVSIDNKRHYEDELFLVLRIPQSSISPFLSLFPADNPQTPLSIPGWSGMVAPTLASFRETSTLHPHLKDEVFFLSLPSPDSTLPLALAKARDSGIDLTALVTAYISRASLLPYQRKLSPDLLIMIFAGPDAQILAGWSSSSSEPPAFQDMPNMQRLRLLYNLDARPILPPPPVVPPNLSIRPGIASLPKQRVSKSLVLSRVVGVEARVKSLEILVRDLQDKLGPQEYGTEEYKAVV